ncbi:MAG: DNA polymerase III subunit gamma/tau [Candidatus Melainabacteria bacterium]|nr:DNA polymerase III subunit gamma/tau [Candidatus Melainabacteria bacterium]MBI3308473.1 DNA polymerase III subunit gamma/tau [Candidatus Melainabacteria bacterium]
MKQYKPLYLKYRPQSLSEVIGQKVVTKTLTNAIKFERIVHAYLFCGPRGTGKTSTARILAKSLNCEKGITESPCNKCVSCTSIMQGNSLDVIEIDAASHRKVEDAEDLINRVNLGTYGSRYKVYIIDEVHMLTDHAFNALLKTLEEPPKNVIFILATTEEHKVIPTIISRCQKLEFKLVVEKDLEERIKFIAKEEKINISDSIVSFITKRSGGCLRDAVSFLDQISVLQEGDKEIDVNEVYELFGVVDRASLFDLLKAILSFNKQEAIFKAEELVKSGKDIGELYKSFTRLVIDVAKAKSDDSCKTKLAKELKDDMSILKLVSINHILKLVDKFQEGQAKLRYSLSQELHFLTEILSMLDEDFLISLTDLKEQVDKLTGTSVSKPIKSNEKPKSTSIQPEEKLKTDVVEDESEIEPIQVEKAEEALPSTTTWEQILNLINSNPTRTLLMQSGGHLLALNGDCIEIGLTKDMFLPRLKSDKKKAEIILQAVKDATELEPRDIKYRVVENAPKNMVQEQLPRPSTIQEGTKDNVLVKPVLKTSSEDDALSGAIKDLFGAKELS